MRYLLLIILLLANHLSAQSQCDDRLEPSDNKTISYQMRGNRCEGFYNWNPGPAGGPRLELIGCTLGEFRFKNDAAEVITLRLNNTTKQDVNIRAEGIPYNLYYRMDATLQAGQTLNWEVSSVLLKDARTTRDYNIAIVAFQGENYERVFFPVASQSKLLPKSTVKDVLILQFISSSRLVSFKYQLGDSPLKSLPGSFPDGRPIRLKLNANLPKGLHELTVKYRSQKNPEEITRRYQLQL